VLLGFVERKLIVFVLALPVLDLHYWCWRAGSDTLAASDPMPSARYQRKGAYRLILALPVPEFHCWCWRLNSDMFTTGAS